MKLNLLGKLLLSVFATAGAVAANAQADGDNDVPSYNLNLPDNPQFLGNSDPTVHKATAIVNGYVITNTDVDQRLAFILLASDQKPSPEELQQLRGQVLRNLVDEALEIQASVNKEIKTEKKDVDAYYQQYAKNLGQTPQQFTAFLREHGSSEASVRRQITGEIAWRRLQGREIEPFVNVGNDEVNAIIKHLNDSKGAQEYRVAEIFLSATPETAPQVQANAARIVQQLRSGASFSAFAHQFSEASTASVGGDLGWVRAEQLPDPLAQAVKTMPVDTISDPIPVQGGFSIIAVADTRRILTTDLRDSVLSLKQLSISFAAGVPKEQAQAKVQELIKTGESMGGCGGADAAAAKIGAEVVTSDQIKVRDLPAPLQDMLLRMSIGQVTRPFGTLEEGVRILVLCGRDDPQTADAPSFDQIYNQLSEQRVNMRAQRYLRDLRRDAIVEYR